MSRKYHRYTKEELLLVVPECLSFAEVARRFEKSPVGGTCTNIKFMCQKWDIDTSHMTGGRHAKGKPSGKRKPATEILVYGSSTDRRTKAEWLRRALMEVGVEYKCNVCGMEPVWNGNPITLEVDHVDEQYWNNTKENLQFICSNCHTQKTAERKSNTKHITLNG